MFVTAIEEATARDPTQSTNQWSPQATCYNYTGSCLQTFRGKSITYYLKKNIINAWKLFIKFIDILLFKYVNFLFSKLLSFDHFVLCLTWLSSADCIEPTHVVFMMDFNILNLFSICQL